MLADGTPVKQRGRPFPKGVSGNPQGRPLGSRNKLSEAFLTDFYQAWQELGPEALRRCAVENPKDFIKVAAMEIVEDE
jgi:hypothetical protein